jgi:transposase-like protein
MARQAKVRERYFCPECRQTFTETFDTLYYRRGCESGRHTDCTTISCSYEVACEALAGARGLAYDTVASIVHSSAQKAQMVHNAQVSCVDTDAIAASEMWSFVEKNKNTACRRK